MVMQQGAIVPVWGWADEGEVVTVSFRNQSHQATAHGGKWMVRLGELKAGGPDVLTVEGKNRLKVKNVLVGEVWICSGQSNMEWPVWRSYQPETALSSSANPQLRFFTVPNTKSDTPMDDVRAQWRECSVYSVADFSAVGYFFGRNLQAALQVPVGLIHTSWGGSPAEVWMSDAALRTSYSSLFEAHAEAFKRYEAESLQFEQEKQQLEREGKAPTRPAPRVPWKPTELYNGMIRPIIPYAIKGAIWYQGEANAGRAQQYRTLFHDLIRNWRRDWGQGDFTFLLVQLAPWDKNRKRTLAEITAQPGDSDWAELREAQLLSTRVLPNVGMAVITDLGEKDDIHPKRKEPVGARLALAARAIAYGQKVPYSGPVFRELQVKGKQAILSFDHAGDGLQAQGGELQGFAICGPDRKFVWAKAEIQRDKVVVSSPEVDQPLAVRYGWADFPVGNLWNKAGLPASPFRTDSFPLTTR
jgi:sialate O-acetylesterase